MKVKLLAAAGVAIFAGVMYYFLRKKEKVQNQLLPGKENERHHLTNVFSKAKEVAMGN